MMRHPLLRFSVVWLFLITTTTIGMAQEVKPSAKPVSPSKPEAPKGSEPVAAEGTLESDSVQQRRLREQAEAWLRLPTDVVFVDDSLGEVIQSLADQHKARIRIDQKSLAEGGEASIESPVDLETKGQPLSYVLNRILVPLKLDWIVVRGEIVITTKEMADATLERRTYPIGRLKHLMESAAKRLPFPTTDERLNPPQFFGRGAGAHGMNLPDPKETVETEILFAIQSLVGFKWTDVDGEGGTMAIFDDQLSVRQTYHAHEQITHLLRTLEVALGRKRGSPALPVMSPEDSKRWNIARQELHRDVPLHWSKTPLKDVIEQLNKQIEVDVYVDRGGLSEENVRPDDTELNLPTGVYSINSAIESVVVEHTMKAITTDGAIQITTEERSSMITLAVIYDVADLFRSADDGEKLREFLSETIPGPWIDRDGEGGIVHMISGGLVGIRHTEDAHSQIATLFQEIRDARKTTAEEVQKPAPEKLELRFHRAKSKDEAEILERLIVRFVAPQSWEESGGKGLIRTAEDRIIINHVKSIHDEVDQFLRDYQQAKPITPAK